MISNRIKYKWQNNNIGITANILSSMVGILFDQVDFSFSNVSTDITVISPYQGLNVQLKVHILA